MEDKFLQILDILKRNNIKGDRFAALEDISIYVDNLYDYIFDFAKKYDYCIKTFLNSKFHYSNSNLEKNEFIYYKLFNLGIAILEKDTTLIIYENIRLKKIKKIIKDEK